MGVEWSQRVWKHARARGSDLVVLLAIADMIPDGERACWPSLGHLAAKARLTVRSTERSLTRLVASREITRQFRDGRSTLYAIHTPGVSVAPDAHVTPDVDVTHPRRRRQVETKRKRKDSEKTSSSPRTVWPATLVLTPEIAATFRAGGCLDPTLGFANCRDHFVGKGVRMADWGATLRNWARRHNVYPCPCGARAAPARATKDVFAGVKNFMARRRNDDGNPSSRAGGDTPSGLLAAADPGAERGGIRTGTG